MINTEKEELKDGRSKIYEGELKDGKRNGQGIMRYVNGDIYDGKWDGILVDINLYKNV